MLRIGLKFGSIFFLPLFWGCSYLVQFAVLNEAKTEIKVTVTYRSKVFKQVKPALAAEPGFLGNYEFLALAKNAIMRHEKAKSLTVSLKAGQALRIFEIFNYSGPTSHRAKNFGATQVVIEKGEVKKTYGPEPNLLTFFEREKKALYFLRIK